MSAITSNILDDAGKNRRLRIKEKKAADKQAER
jgi:hypothetical protein